MIVIDRLLLKEGEMGDQEEFEKLAELYKGVIRDSSVSMMTLSDASLSNSGRTQESLNSDGPNSLHDSLRELTKEIKFLQSRVVPLGKERTFLRVLLSTQEENIILKAQLKAMEEKDGSGGSSPSVHKDNDSVDAINNLERENSLLQHQVKYWQSKSESEQATILKLESTIKSLKATSMELKLCDEMSECVEIQPTKLSAVSITNKKLYRSLKELVRPLRMVISKTIVECTGIFDQDADVSICGPDTLKNHYQSISPPMANPYNFPNGSKLTCLGHIKVTLSDPARNTSATEATLYVFNEVKTLVLCRKDWMAL